jgi:glycosyltransferase involved in cell wall biosynthesis
MSINNFKNILIAHNDYGKFSGEEHAVQTMAEVLAENGYQVSWLRKTSAGIENSLYRKMHAFFSGIYSINSRKEIENLLDRNDFDIIQVQNLYPLLSPSILVPCQERNIPVVMRCPNYRLFCPNGLHLSHGTVCEKCLGGCREWNCILHNCEGSFLKSSGYAARNAFARLTGMILDNVSMFIALSEFQKQRFITGGIPADRIEILPNISPSIDNSQRSGDLGNTISFVGRVSPEKGISTFINAACKLPQYSFAVAGSTNGMPEIVDNAPDNVAFHGFLSGRELDDFFHTSRIMVFPSNWFEGFPNVIAKAMAHGRPVIAAWIGAIPEIVDNSVTGLLFEPGNVDDLVEKIQHLWGNTELCRQLGKAGQKKARSEYSQKKYHDRLMSIYNKAIDKQFPPT